MDAPIISDVVPATTIRKSPYSNNEPFIEQVRLSSPVQERLLPSISMKKPSRLRDAFRLILASGAPEVDFILARSPVASPWDFHLPELVDMFIPFLNANQGAILVYPDAGGPWPRNSLSPMEDNYDRRQNLLKILKIFGPHYADNFQLALMDFVSPPENELQSYLYSLQGHDVSLCNWSGEYRGLRRHGWRPACAAVGGYISSRPKKLTQSLIGQKIHLGSGRKIVENRSTVFGAPKRPRVNGVVNDSCVTLEINDVKGTAQIMSEMSFRRPMHEWALPALRTVKSIHMALIRASELFVFRPVKKVEAIALKTAVEMVLDPFYSMGIVVGPDGIGKPQITSDAIPDYDEPMLTVDLSAQVRPWCQSISLKVMVKSGTQPMIMEA